MRYIPNTTPGKALVYHQRVLEVLKVVDGDTLDLRLALGFGLEAKLRFRLHGIDAPELYGPQASEEGREAKSFVESWIAGRELAIRSHKGSDATVGLGSGMFGQWYAEVIDYNTGENLGDAIRKAGFDQASPATPALTDPVD